MFLSIQAKLTLITTYINYATMALFGYLHEFYSKVFDNRTTRKGYAPLLKDFEDFFARNFFRRVMDCWGRPIASNPGAWIDLLGRVSHDFNRTIQLTGEKHRCLNLASYNYLGFADNSEYCLNNVLESIDKFGVATSSVQSEFGNQVLLAELEETTARFVGKEAAIVCGMGFATNSTCIPAMCGEGSLIISDSKNHSSIVTGTRSSGAKIKVFKHNDVASLESVIQDSIINGQPRTRRPWKKIIIIVEGIYSMEGETCPLAEIIQIKKKYKCYLYIDEAHSIGALGPNGRGVCDHCGVNPDDVDVLMGTFTKSFGSIGGYVAGSKAFIAHLKRESYHALYGTSMPAPSMQQALSALKVIMGEDGSTIGQEKIKALKDNSNFFREGLIKLGFEVYGEKDSPVIPVMLYNPPKVIMFSRECLKRNLAVVVVGFPATSLIAARVRFCISAGHTIEDLSRALQIIDEVGDVTMSKYMKYTDGSQPIVVDH